MWVTVSVSECMWIHVYECVRAYEFDTDICTWLVKSNIVFSYKINMKKSCFSYIFYLKVNANAIFLT